jgi:hypothetical protein
LTVAAKLFSSAIFSLFGSSAFPFVGDPFFVDPFGVCVFTNTNEESFDDDSFGNEINGFPILCKTYEAYMKFGKMNDVKFLFQMNNPNIKQVFKDCGFKPAFIMSY